MSPKLWLIIAIVVVACSTERSKEESDKPKPNVLFISIDDLRPALGVYGDSLAITPNIDRLSESSYVFENTFCQSAVCAPSRASLMTGLRPDSTRVWHLGDKFRELNPNILTLPQVFKHYGYHTVNIGKIFHNYMPDSVSWDEPDLRPAKYLRKEWLARDGETFYVNEETQRLQKIKRDSLIAKGPIYYADGWNNGPAWEMEDVHDSDYFDGAQVELAKKVLDRVSKKEEPFFMGLGFFRPHLPFAVPKKYWDLYDPEKIGPAANPDLPQNVPVMSSNLTYELRGYNGFKHIKHPGEYKMSADTARMLKHGYYASVSYVDALIGDLIQHLIKLGIDQNTLIVLWGDHGWKLGEHNSWCKQTNFDVDLHVPLIVYDPRSPGGVKINGITELVDLYPSLCELAGIPSPNYMQGQSFVPLFSQPDREWKKAAFSQFHRRPKVTPDGGRYMGYSIRRKDYHYIMWYAWDKDKEVRTAFVVDELYDLEKDPLETKNVAEDVSYGHELLELRQQLKLGWRWAQADPSVKAN